MKIKSLALCFLVTFHGSTQAFSDKHVSFVEGVLGSLIVFCCYFIYKEVNDPLWRYRLVLSACSKNNFFLLPCLFLNGDRDIFRIGKNNNIGQVDGYSFPLLESAIKNNNHQLVDFLMQRGCKFDYTTMTDACEANDIELVQKYLSAGWMQTALKSKICSYALQEPLSYAYRNGNKDLIELLLNAGIPILSIEFAFFSLEGLSIANWLVEKGAEGGNLQSLERVICIIARKVEENKTNFSEIKQLEIEHSLDTIVTLIGKEKINISSCNIFLEAGRSIDYLDVLYRLLSLLYEIGKNDQNFERLVTLHSSDSMGRNCLEIAIINNDIQLLKKLLENDNAQKITKQTRNDLCFKACEKSYRDIVQYLFDQNAVDDEGNTLLHVAACKSCSFLQEAMLCCDNLPQALRAKNNNNETVFYTAITQGAIDNPITDFLPYIHNDSHFLQKELFRAVRVFKNKDINNFIFVCNMSTLRVNRLNMFNFNYRNRKGRRPVDNAIEQYKYAVKCLPYNSKDFTVKEKIMHVFLCNTPCYNKDTELIKKFKEYGLVDDVIKGIMHYHHGHEVERLVAERLVKDSTINYYQKTKSDKQQFRQETIALEDKKISNMLLERG